MGQTCLESSLDISFANVDIEGHARLRKTEKLEEYRFPGVRRAAKKNILMFNDGRHAEVNSKGA